MSLNIDDINFDFLEDELREGFRIETKDQAIWVLRKVKKYMEEQEENKEAADAEIERISAWLEEENVKLQKQIDYFTGLLEEYHRAILEQDPKKKTIKLPHGELQFRKQQPKFERDDITLVRWLKEKKLKDFIEVKERPMWSELKKYVEVRDGYVFYDKDKVEGIMVEEQEDKFSIKVV